MAPRLASQQGKDPSKSTTTWDAYLSSTHPKSGAMDIQQVAEIGASPDRPDSQHGKAGKGGRDKLGNNQHGKDKHGRSKGS